MLWRACLLCEQGAFDCVVLEMSVNGARIRLTRPQPEVTPYALRIPRFGDFPGEEIWRRRRTVGFRFLEAPRNVARTILDTLPECVLGVDTSHLT